VARPRRRCPGICLRPPAFQLPHHAESSSPHRGTVSAATWRSNPWMSPCCVICEALLAGVRCDVSRDPRLGLCHNCVRVPPTGDARFRPGSSVSEDDVHRGRYCHQYFPRRCDCAAAGGGVRRPTPAFAPVVAGRWRTAGRAGSTRIGHTVQELNSNAGAPRLRLRVKQDSFNP
jgi:hypothetical protein